MLKEKFSELNCDEMLDVTGGSITLGAVIGAIVAVSAAVGGAFVQKREYVVEKAYNEAYDAEMLRLNLENPIPYGDLIREYYEQKK